MCEHLCGIGLPGLTDVFETCKEWLAVSALQRDFCAILSLCKYGSPSQKEQHVL